MTDLERDEHETPVIFRKFGDGQIIALFPTLPGTNYAGTCASYMHIGQHGAADPDGVIEMTRPATPAERTDLFIELDRLGYRLKVIHRVRYRHYKERERALGKMAAKWQGLSYCSNTGNARVNP